MNVRENLKAYLDGELNAEDMQSVARAVESDAGLREELEFMRALGFEIKRVVGDVVPVGAERVAAAVRRKPRWSWPTSPIGRLGLAGGALAACLLVVAVVGPAIKRSTGSYSESAELVSYSRTASPGMAPGTDAAPMDAEVKSEAPNEAIAGADKQAHENGVLSEGTDSPATGADAGPNMAIVQPERMVVRNGTIMVRVGGGTESQLADAKKGKPARAVYVETVSEAVEKTTQIARSFGGYVENASYSGMQGSLPTANLTIRVASKNFDPAMKQLREMGVVMSESMSGEDVTAQYADIDGRLKVMRAEADSYVTMLRAARRVGEIMEIKDRLSQVRQQIESYESQRRSLKNLSSLSTINATFQQRVAVGKPGPNDEDWSGSAWARAVNGLAAAGQFLGQAAIFIFVYSPIWLSALIIIWLILRAAKPKN